MNCELDKIAKEENTDKNSDYHGYAEKYDFYFQNIKNSPTQMLEIGVLNGSSLRMWDRYFSSIQISGIDINPDCKRFEKQNIKIYIGDQSDTEFLSRNFSDSEFDIIVDDGSHIPSHQIASFEFLFKKLKPGGIYVVEDLHTSYCNHSKFSSEGVSFVDYLKNRVDDLQLNGKDAQEWSYGNKKNHLNVVGWDKINDYNYFEKNIEFIHFYKSIVFIKKEIW
jgi:predicted O-methyltransferase YrrM